MKAAPAYDDSLTLREARDRYFAVNGFGADGGYGKKWEKMTLGPLSFYVPNTDGRVRAIRAHDLHHVMTGYATDWMGEFEISAWELAGGCADHGFAWLINLSGLVAGMALSPRRMFQAFVRGQQSQNLYRTPYDTALLSSRVGEIRARLGLERDRPAQPVRLRDVAAFAAYLAIGLPVSLGWLLFLPMVLPYAAVTAHLRRRDADTVLSESRT